MGKVQNTFKNVYPGAVSRSVDTIVISEPNGGAAAVAFGEPIFLDATTKKARGFVSGDNMDNFLGIACRNGIKTPNVYGSNVADYEVNEMMDIVVRGSVCIPVETSATAVAIGGKVYLDANGKFTADATGNTEMTNLKFRPTVGVNNVAEVVITTRNIQ